MKIVPSISDDDLDILFLSSGFDKAEILTLLSTTNHDSSPLQDTHLKQIETAIARLKKYLEVLTNQIVKIVEKESDSFMDVASKLDGFRQILTDLKDSHNDFHMNFVNEKGKTDKVYGYLVEQYTQL